MSYPQNFNKIYIVIWLKFEYEYIFFSKWYFVNNKQVLQ